VAVLKALGRVTVLVGSNPIPSARAVATCLTCGNAAHEPMCLSGRVPIAEVSRIEAAAVARFKVHKPEPPRHH
jgi:hypothetical protein